MSTTFHVQMSIEGALKLSDKKLGRLFERDGQNVRKELQARFAKGERLIGSSDCEGFDPVTGCPGHEDEND